MDAVDQFATLQNWAESRIDMRIECACGRTVNIPSNPILGRFRFDSAVSEAAKPPYRGFPYGFRQK